jgi:fumarylacetoacetase
MLNETHDPLLRSWVITANTPTADFPIQNLPLGIFRRRGSNESFRPGVAVGDQILDLPEALAALELTDSDLRSARNTLIGQTSLNEFMAAGRPLWSALRLALSRALRTDARQQAKLKRCLSAAKQAELALPATIGDYTDFYTSIHHAFAVGKLFRPTQPLLPNYRWVPIGYHGRSSSIGVSGQSFQRPWGQLSPENGQGTPTFAPSGRLDFELELGIFIGLGNPSGSCIPLDRADENIFGMSLLNDWSARDLQQWEGQPLGPFLAKNFATTISPWIVTWEALEPYRIPWSRAAEEPPPLPYLDSAELRARGALDIHLEIALQSERMRQRGRPPAEIARSNFRYSYWAVAQLVAHHTINGCNLQPGDLLGTGTQSGPRPEQAGSLLELTHGGREPLNLGGGESRTFLEDGDAVFIRANCQREGAVRIGFGDCVGYAQAARSLQAPP